MGSLDTGTSSVVQLELIGCLMFTSRLQRFVMLTGLQSDGARFAFGFRAMSPPWAGRTVLACEARLEYHTVLLVRIGKPRDALLACRTSNYLPVPIDIEFRFVITFARACLPTGIIGDFTHNRDVIFTLAVD